MENRLEEVVFELRLVRGEIKEKWGTTEGLDSTKIKALPVVKGEMGLRNAATGLTEALQTVSPNPPMNSMGYGFLSK